jgi:ABC-type phosphate transport system substrate-binding protein
MKFYYSIIIILTALIFTASDAQVAVIVNKSNSISKISHSSLKDIYMLSNVKWSDGTGIVVIDNREKSLQQKFYDFINVKDILSVKKQWLRVQLSGEGKAPMVVDGAEEMLAKVASTPGAIGYVRLSDVKGNDVKVIAKSE